MVRIIHYTGQGLGTWQIQIGPVTVPSRYWWLIYGFWSYDADHPGSASRLCSRVCFRMVAFTSWLTSWQAFGVIVYLTAAL